MALCSGATTRVEVVALGAQEQVRQDGDGGLGLHDAQGEVQLGQQGLRFDSNLHRTLLSTKSVEVGPAEGAEIAFRPCPADT